MPQIFFLFFLSIFAGTLGATPTPPQLQEDDSPMREELGVNPITAPSIQRLLEKLESFRPIPMDLLSSNPRQASFSNRFQNALHFGSLVADGFMLTIAERQDDVRDIGRALIRKAQSLDIADRLTRRGKSLLELSDKGNWIGMRQELIRTQADVEQSMMDLKDDAMADIVSLGGWLRGFQLACTAIQRNYLSTRAQMLVDLDVMDYYIGRLETLHPRLRKTELVQDMTTTLKKIREIASQAQDRPPTREEVDRMKALADRLFADMIAPLDEGGNLPASMREPSPKPRAF